MKRLNNRGVSLIEILIAVVIFVMCITPIINQLATGIRIGQKADDQQAATDYGKSLSESLKQADFGELINLEAGTADKTTLASLLQMADAGDLTISCTFYSVKADGTKGTFIPDNSYVIPSSASGDFTIGTGTGYSSVTAMYQALNAKNAVADADKQEALVREYHFTGTSTVDYRTYDVDITLDTKPYAVSSLTSTDYSDPNAVNLGNLSSLDASTTAVITSASNYDTIASASYFNTVLAALEAAGNDSKATQIKEGNDTISNRATKQIKVIVDPITGGDANGNYYKVTCNIIYENPSLTTDYDVPATDTELVYTAYEQKFVNLPDVYMMYNQFLYISEYGDDTITIENNVQDKTVKVYVVRTASTDASVNSIVGINGSDGTENSLLPSANFIRDVKSDSKYLYLTNFNLVNDIADYPVSIYTNISLTQEVGTNVVTNVSSSTANPSDRTCKMTVNVGESSISDVLHSLEDDERYSETGRVYNILISLTNQKSGTVTTFDTSKGDY